MAAAAYTGNLVIEDANTAPGSGGITYRIAGSDVAAAAWTFQDGSSDLVLPAGRNWRIGDLTLSAAGTDTTNSDIYVNGQPSGNVVQNSANLATTVVRQFRSAPMIIRGGSKLRFVQRA